MIKKLKAQISNFKLKWGWAILAGLGIVVLYFVLRLINLTILPIFCDEAIYIRWSQVMWHEPTLRFLPLSDGKQPLFMWLTIPFLKLFSDPLVAGRMVSIFSGLGTILGAFLLSLTLFKSKRIALLSSFLYAVSPFAVLFDRMALVDSLLTMFGVWVLYFGVLLIRYQRLDLAMITGIILGGAFLTKSPAIFFALLLPSTVLLLTRKKNFLVQIFKLIGLWLVVFLFAFGIYNVLRLGPNFNMIAARNKDYVFSFQEILSHPLDPFKPHVGQIWEWFWFFLTPPVILVFIAGLAVGIKKFPRQTVLLLIWLLVPLLTQMAFAKVFTARYVLFIIPLFLILAAVFLEWVIEKVRGLKFILVFLGLLFFPALQFNYHLLTNPQKVPLPEGERRGYLEDWTSGYGISEVRDYLKSLSSDKQIIVGTEGSFGTLPDGLLIYFDKDPKVTVIGVGLGLDKIPEPLSDSSSKGNPTFLVANKSRMGAQNDPGLKLVMEIPKAKGKSGQDSLLFYQVK